VAVLARRVDDVDDARRRSMPASAARHHLRMVAVRDQHLGAAVLQPEADGRSVEARVDGVEERAPSIGTP
jgi:hypothetical protein